MSERARLQPPAKLAFVLAFGLLGMAVRLGSLDGRAPIEARFDPSQAPTPATTPATFGLVERSRFSTGGTIALSMYRQFVVMGLGNELRIINVANPMRPVIEGRIELGGQASDIVIDGHTAYVAVNTAPLAIIDLQNPLQPRMMSQVSELTSVSYLTVAANHLFAVRFQTVRVYDVHDPQRVVPVSDVPFPVGTSVWDVDWAEGYLYICSSSMLYVFDVREPTRPVLVADVDRPTVRTNFSGMDVSGGVAFVGAQTAGLLVFDISAPVSPTLLAILPPPKGASSFQEPIILGDGTLAVPANSGGVVLIDVAAPARPAIQGQVPAPGNTFRAVGSGRTVFAANIELGLLVIDATDPTAPTQRTAIEDPAPVIDLVLADPWAVVLAIAGRIRIFDVSDMDRPREVARLRLRQHGIALAWGNRVLYVCGVGRILSVVDMSDPSNPRLVTELSLRDPCGHLLASGERLYVAGDDGLTILDIADPLSPIAVGDFRRREIGLSSLATNGIHFFALGSMDNPDTAGLVDIALMAFDVRDPKRAALVGHLNVNALQPTGIALTEDTVSVAGRYGLRWIDVANASAPRLLPEAASIPPSVYADRYDPPVAAADDLVFVATSTSSLSSTLKVLDIYHRDRPELLVEQDLNGHEASLVRVQGNLVALGMSYLGVALYEKVDHRLGQPTATPRRTPTSITGHGLVFLPTVFRRRSDGRR